MFQDLQAAQHGQSGILERRELPRELAQLLVRHAAEREGLAFLPALLAADLGLVLLLLGVGHLRDLGHEVAHLFDLLLRLFLAQGADRILDLASRRVQGLELKAWHDAFSPTGSKQ